jgi:hypothetical protein
MTTKEVEEPPARTGRKVEVNLSLYCPWNFVVFNEDKQCDHDYDPTPVY